MEQGHLRVARGSRQRRTRSYWGLIPTGNYKWGHWSRVVMAHSPGGSVQHEETTDSSSK